MARLPPDARVFTARPARQTGDRVTIAKGDAVARVARRMRWRGGR